MTSIDTDIADHPSRADNWCMSDSMQEIFNTRPRPPEFPDDPDLGLDCFGFFVERHSHGADHSYGWKIDEKGRVIGNIAGTSRR